MIMADQSNLVTLALTSRIVPSEVPPLSAREFWPLNRAVDLPWLLGKTKGEIATELSVPGEQAERVARLLDRGAALALAIEQLEHIGVWTASAGGEHYPEALRPRLGDAAPPLLHGVGDPALLQIAGVGVVGSREIGPEAVDVARRIAYESVSRELPVISGGAKGVDQHAMNAAIEFGGRVVGVLADSLERTVSRPSTRRAVNDGHICLITPYAPRVPFSTGNAMGRNKLIYALSRCVVVVRSEDGTGGTWAGAAEALKRRITAVASWTGAGSGTGNHALIGLGARELDDPGDLGPLLEALDDRHQTIASVKDDQLSLF